MHQKKLFVDEFEYSEPYSKSFSGGNNEFTFKGTKSNSPIKVDTEPEENPLVSVSFAENNDNEENGKINLAKQR